MTDSEEMASPPPEAVAVAIDCNCFLQLRDLQDLPWRELLPGVKRVDVMVMPSVVAELDQKKVDSKDRVRNRARAALQKIDAASEHDPMQLQLRDAPVQINLCLPDAPPTDWSLHPRLDPSRADDRLVAQALDALTSIPKILLSHDSGPRVTARRCGLASKAPPESWHLPDPVDDDRKKIQQLQRENAALLARRPQVTAKWDTKQTKSELLRIERLMAPPLRGEAIVTLVKRCEQLWPLETATVRMGEGFFIGADDLSGEASQYDYSRYVAAWGKWRDGLFAFFEHLHERLANASRIGSVDFLYENLGSATAERLTIEMSTSEGWRLLLDEREAESIAALPLVVPSSPLTPFQQRQKVRAEKADAVGRQFRSMLPHVEKPRIATGFYWIERPNHEGRYGSFECAEFRAKAKQTDTVWLMPPQATSQTGSLTVNIHATNLAAPIDLHLSLEHRDRDAKWSDLPVVELLHPELAKMVQGVA